jgi:hypothetical protein
VPDAVTSHALDAPGLLPWSSETAPWVTVNAWDSPAEVQVTVPVRGVVERLAAAVTVAVAPLAPDVGLTLSQDAPLDAVHLDPVVVTRIPTDP